MTTPEIAPGDHEAYMRHALSLAHLSPPAPTNFRVGAILVNPTTNTILSTGYTLELPGNTHAEQCCFLKIAQQHDIAEEEIGDVLPEDTVLYTTMEPCNKRLSGNRSCVDRILGLKRKVGTVYVGVEEPGKFVGENRGRARLEVAGIRVEVVRGLEEGILEVATAGHEKHG